jgi:hypothetical protein
VASKKCVAAGSTATSFFASIRPPPASFSCSVDYGVNGAATPTGETTLCCRQP